MTFLPHKPGDDAISELAVRLYPSTLESFREAIANALDAEGSRRVELTVNPIQVIVEDWGRGIDDVNAFATYGHQTKLKTGNTETIGRKGMGKLSLLRMNPKVNFKTNAGKFDINLDMDLAGIDFKHGGSGEYLPHRGTKITIDKPKDLPLPDELQSYLKKTFGLRIARGAEIILNGTKLGVDKTKIDTDEKFIVRLKGGVDITGNLQQSAKGTGAVDVYVNHVFIAREIVDPNREFSGWVNCNSLEPSTSRNELVHDDVYNDMMTHIKAYVARFPLRDAADEVGRSDVHVGNELAKMLKSFLKDNADLLSKSLVPITVEGLVEHQLEVDTNRLGKTPAGKQGSGTSQDVQQPDKYKNKIHTSVVDPDKKVVRRLKTDYNIEVVYQELGNEKEPLIYVYPTTMVVNTTNDLYRFAMKEKLTLGYKWLRLLPWLSRIAVKMNPNYQQMTTDEVIKAVDETYRYFLKVQGELPQ